MSSNWWRDETFWRDIGPFLFSQAHMARAEEETEDILEELELDPGARILDVGCGPGRILIPLVARGFDVVGLDTCDQYRRQARAAAQKRQLTVDVRAGDVFELQLDETPFDAVLDVFAVLGYHLDPGYDVHAVRKMYEALGVGGQLLIHTRMPSTTRGTLKHHAGGAVCIERREWDSSTKTMTTTWTIVTRGGQRVHRSRVRVYTKDDLRGLLDFCGFEAIRAYESPSEERVIVVGERPAVDRPFSE